MATADIVGAYLNVDMDRFNTLKLEGDMVNLMVQVNPEKYAEYIHYKKVKRCYTLDC